MKKRRQWTTYSGSGKRVAPRTRTSRVSRGKEMGVPRLWVQLIVCGALFVALIGLKLLMPGNLSALRGTLGQWLVRDADFISAFSAVGRAASGEQDWGDSLSEAYVAVFGGESKAQEVSGNLIGMTVSEQDVSDLTSARELPALAVGEQRILGFSYTTPLSGTVTSPFGWRDDPNGAGECFHYGMDIAGEEGASVACFADGTVGTVGESNILGNYVTVNHEGGFSTLYAHCSAITASAGQSVKKGDAIAKVGSTGNATGSHLHFEVHDGEEYLNPFTMRFPERGLHVSWSFWLLILLAAIVSPITIVLSILLAAALHECGHLLALRAFHVPIEGLRLSAFGAVLHARGAQRLSYGRELVVTLAGCGMNLVCGVLTAWFSLHYVWVEGFVFAGAHILLCAFNLLPIPPLDGSHALNLAVSTLFGPLVGDEVAALAGVLCSLALLGGVVYLYVQTRGGALVIFAALALLLSALKELRLARRAIKV